MSPRVADDRSVTSSGDLRRMVHREQLALRRAEEVRTHVPTRGRDVFVQEALQASRASSLPARPLLRWDR